MPYKQRYWNVSRLVVLPDYQGVGIGTKFLTATAKIMNRTYKLPVHITSSNPQLKSLIKHPNWKLTHYGHVTGKVRFRKKKKIRGAERRLTMSFKYVG